MTYIVAESLEEIIDYKMIFILSIAHNIDLIHWITLYGIIVTEDILRQFQKNQKRVEAVSLFLVPYTYSLSTSDDTSQPGKNMVTAGIACKIKDTPNTTYNFLS